MVNIALRNRCLAGIGMLWRWECMNFEAGLCVNDISARRKLKAEEKEPKLLDDIQVIMTPQSQAEPRLRTTLLYTNMTAQAVYDSLRRKG